jgi:hypothetical protein
MTALNVVEPQVLDATAARAATDRLRLTLTDAHEQLIALWRDRAHEALNYGAGAAGWAAYCAAEFGELLNVLPTAEQLGAMADAGMPQRAIAAPFGVSLGKVNGRLKARAATLTETAAGHRTSPDHVSAGCTRPAAVPAHVRVAELVAAAGTKGLTIPQAQRRTGWSYGATSGALSRAEARGLVTRPVDVPRRGGFRPYLGAL